MDTEDGDGLTVGLRPLTGIKDIDAQRRDIQDICDFWFHLYLHFMYYK